MPINKLDGGERNRKHMTVIPEGPVAYTCVRVVKAPTREEVIGSIETRYQCETLCCNRPMTLVHYQIIQRARVGRNNPKDQYLCQQCARKKEHRREKRKARAAAGKPEPRSQDYGVTPPMWPAIRAGRGR